MSSVLYAPFCKGASDINKNTLAESVWGDHIDQADSLDFIYSQVKNLRKKMKAAGTQAEIKAVYGFGYKLAFDMP